MELSDARFLQQFESRALAPEFFDHRGHLRLAWLYLCRYPLREAIDRVATGIRDYADSLGATGKFHYTLTEASVRIIASRMQEASHHTLAAFLAANSDLVDDLPAVVGTYYSDELLHSGRARSEYVPPDRASLDIPDAA